MTTTVYTTKEFNDAYVLGVRDFICKGDLARQLRRKLRTKRTTAIASASIAVIGGIIAAPFTGGSSLALAGAGLTVGSLTITTAELALLLGGGVALMALSKGQLKTISFAPDGSVLLEFKTE